MTVIVTAVGAIEPHLSHDDVRTAIEGMGLSAAQLQRLSRTLRRDGSVLTGPGGSDCAADIEQLILCLRQLGAMRVRAPRCAPVRPQRFRNLLAQAQEAHLPSLFDAGLAAGCR
nr:hypothetical protein [Mycobacterium avium]